MHPYFTYDIVIRVTMQKIYLHIDNLYYNEKFQIWQMIWMVWFWVYLIIYSIFSIYLMYVFCYMIALDSDNNS